jgi:hypothetical protein
VAIFTPAGKAMRAFSADESSWSGLELISVHLATMSGA